MPLTENGPVMDEMPPKGKSRYTTISIPQPLYEEIKQHIAGTGFRSPTEYLVYVTRMSLQQPARAATGPGAVKA